MKFPLAHEKNNITEWLSLLEGCVSADNWLLLMTRNAPYLKTLFKNILLGHSLLAPL